MQTDFLPFWAGSGIDVHVQVHTSSTSSHIAILDGVGGVGWGIIYIYIAPDNYLEHRFGNFSVGTRALLRTFSANRGTYVLSDLEHMRILYLEHAIIYTCKYMYMYTYIQLNTAYLYYIYRWCDVALRYMEMSILRYIEII